VLNLVRLHAALRSSSVLQIAQGVVRSVQVSSAGVVGRNPAGPHRGDNDGSVSAHAVDNCLLGGAVKSRRVVEGPLGLAVLAELHGEVAVVGDVHVDLEGAVAVDGTSEVDHLAASPRIATAVGADMGVHGTSGELVSVGFEDVKLDASISAVHERLAVVAVKVTSAHQGAGDHEVEVGVNHVINFGQVNGEGESSAQQVQLLLRVVTHASLSRESISDIRVVVFVHEVAILSLAWRGGRAGRSRGRGGSRMWSVTAHTPALRAVPRWVTCSGLVDPIAVAIGVRPRSAALLPANRSIPRWVAGTGLVDPIAVTAALYLERRKYSPISEAGDGSSS